MYIFVGCRSFSVIRPDPGLTDHRNWENLKAKPTPGMPTLSADITKPNCIQIAPWIPALDKTKLDLRHFDSLTSDSVKSNSPTSVEEMAISLQDVSTDGLEELTDSFQLNNSIDLGVVSSDLVARAPAVQKMLQPRPPLLMSRRRTSHVSCLETVEEAGNEDSCDELPSSINTRDILEKQVREQVAKNRASFWDNLSDVNSVSSSRSMDFKAGLGISSGLLKLRRSKSAATLLDTFTTSSRKKVQNTSSPVVPDIPEVDLDLPKGITQNGRGIGFNYALNAAAISNVSICSTTPRSCHGISLRCLFASFGRKKEEKINIPLESPVSAYDDDQDMTDIMMEFGVSAKDLSVPPTNETPELSQPRVLVQPNAYVPSFDMSSEVVADDPDATLRLVSS